MKSKVFEDAKLKDSSWQTQTACVATFTVSITRYDVNREFHHEE